MNPSLTDQARHDTVRWLEKAVIGLNLCPFAKAPHVKGLVHVCVSLAQEPEAILQALREELQALADCPETERETTLLVLPLALPDFQDFNDFQDAVEAEVEALDLDGVLQVAPFHPRFQFAGTHEDDIGNATNRSPYPTLHLIRESGIDRAVAAFPEAEVIFEANIRTLARLGEAGWQALDVGPHAPAGARS